MATKCTSCGSVACDRAAAFAARIAADSAFSDAVKARKSVSALYPALKAAEERFSKAWTECCARGNEHDRQMCVFIAALKVYVSKSTYLLGCAVSEGVRQSMLPGRFGATMLCMRGAR